MANGLQANPRFSTLTGLGTFITFAGWIVVIVGAVLLFMGLSKLGDRSAFGGGMSFMGLASGVGVVLYGLLMVAAGQAITCFVSIENNTFETMQTQRRLLNQVNEQFERLEQTLPEKQGTGTEERAGTDRDDPD